MRYFIVLILSLWLSSAYGQNTRVQNFSSAKKILKKFNYLGMEKEIYCGCKVTSFGKFDKNSCGYKPKKDNARAWRLEAEHVVPFENLVGHTKAWDYGVPECKGKKGRKCASEVYGEIEGDLWNLMPSLGELNGLRSNYQIAEIPGEERAFGTCDFEIQDRKMEPPEEVKSLVAVTYKYMQDSYAKKLSTNYISSKNEKLIEAWSKKPLPAWACSWGKKVSQVQGNENKHLVDKCRAQNLW